MTCHAGSSFKYILFQSVNSNTSDLNLGESPIRRYHSESFTQKTIQVYRGCTTSHTDNSFDSDLPLHDMEEHYPAIPRGITGMNCDTSTLCQSSIVE